VGQNLWMLSDDEFSRIGKQADLDDLQNIEIPFLQIIFESKDQKMSVGEVGKGEERLIGKIAESS